MVLGASRVRWWSVVLFLFATSIRLFRVDWDQHHFFHPDERAIGFAIDRLSFSPLQLNPHFFAYGSFLLYVIKCVTALLGNFHPSLRGFDASVSAGRVIAALGGADARTNIAIAFRELAENSAKIGELNITPDLLRTLLATPAPTPNVAPRPIPTATGT